MRVLSLDLSLTATGWARNLIEPPPAPPTFTIDYGVISPRSKGAARLQEVLDRVARLSDGVELAVLEGYAYASPKFGASHAHSLGELGGVIRLFLFQKKIPWVELAPAVVKKLATGSGAADKAAVLVEAVKRLKYDRHDNNEADALFLLQAALIHYGLPGAATLPQQHLDALKKVEWPELAERVA